MDSFRGFGFPLSPAYYLLGILVFFWLADLQEKGQKSIFSFRSDTSEGSKELYSEMG